jgi:hypothetical protein
MAKRLNHLRQCGHGVRLVSIVCLAFVDGLCEKFLGGASFATDNGKAAGLAPVLT